jgi:hypothetical protein
MYQYIIISKAVVMQWSIFVMLYRIFRFVGSCVAYVFEELADSHKTSHKTTTRREPTLSTINIQNEENELPPIQLD